MTCPRCGSASFVRGSCLPCGWEPQEFVAVADEAGESRVGLPWTEDEKAIVRSMLATHSYRLMADALPGRTARGIEHLVRTEGWAKRYVRRGGEWLAPLPRSLKPDERTVAVLLRERAAAGWAVSLAGMAHTLGMWPSNVRRAVRGLVARGLVEQEQRADQFWGRKASVYRWTYYQDDRRGEGGEKGKEA